ncbi:hypothetical protein STEG23_032626, partial [Scotinomys teguina]
MCEIFHCKMKNLDNIFLEKQRSEEIAQYLEVYDAPADDLGSVPSTHISKIKHLLNMSRHSVPSEVWELKVTLSYIESWIDEIIQ